MTGNASVPADGDISCEVTIIGAGPAGLSSALMLHQRGIDVRLFERHAAPSTLPRAHLVNLRTMEIFRTVGVAERVYQLSPPEDKWHRVGWYTTLAGERAEDRVEIGHLQAWGGGTDWDRYGKASPERFCNVPQMRLDPVLADAVVATVGDRAFYNHEAVDIEQDGAGATVTVLDRDTGHTIRVRSRYVIGADGGRLCSELLGVQMNGATKLQDMVSMHITADLSPWVIDDQVLLHRYLGSEFDGTFAVSLCAMGPDTWGAHSKEWALHQSFAYGDPRAHEHDAVLRRGLALLGLPDLRPEVHAVSHWEFEGVYAQQYRKGNVFLVGNAAHRHPPTGGLGLNTAVQDAHNLAWKLALVLRGKAGPKLLDTYHDERHAIGKFNVEHSLTNHAAHRPIAAALGQDPDHDEELNRAAIRTFLAATTDGERLRAEVAAAVAANADDYSQLNVEVGFAYESGALIPDGSPPPATHGSLRDYTPTTRPGHHLPHCNVQRDGCCASTLYLIDRDRLSLIFSSEARDHWECALAGLPRAIRECVVPIEIGDRGDIRDPDGEWERLRGVTAHGAVLVRPDWHIAWRSHDHRTGSTDDLENVVRAVLSL